MITNIQLMEWLAKGNGIAKNDGGSQCIPYLGSCPEDMLDKPIREAIRIRKWNDTEWHIPSKEYMGIK